MTISKFFEIWGDAELKIFREETNRLHICAALYNPEYTTYDCIVDSEREIEYGMQTIHYSFIAQLEEKLKSKTSLEDLIKRAKEECEE